MRKKIIGILVLLLWNIFMLVISKDHIAPNVVIWMAGFGTGGFVRLFYFSNIKK